MPKPRATARVRRSWRTTDALWAEIQPTYEAILDLPFNRELAAGTLSRERFIFYMVQDAHYLGARAKAPR